MVVNITQWQSVGLLTGLWVSLVLVEYKEEGQLNHTFPLKFLHSRKIILLRGWCVCWRRNCEPTTVLVLFLFSSEGVMSSSRE